MPLIRKTTNSALSLLALVTLVANIILASTPASASFFSSKPGSLQTAALRKLPVATEHQGALLHLSASISDCTGCPTAYASPNGTFTVNAYVTWGPKFFTDFVPHPGGWEFRHVRESCPNGRLEARRKGSQAVQSVALLQMGRLQGFVDRRLSCLFTGSSDVYSGIVANSRYLAFETAEPGLVFFDLEAGRFVPWALTTEHPSGGVGLYADQAGALYVDEGFAPSAGRKLHRVVLGDQDLAAPLSKEAICQGRAIAKGLGSYSVDRPAPGFDCN